MKRMGLFWVLLAAMGLSGAGCTEEEAAESPTAAPGEAAPIPELAVAEVAALLEAGEAVAFDANSDSTRREEGIVPSARLLTSSGRYDPEAELPEDRSAKLVFYCGNEHCNASDGAAARARDAGWANVSVMRAGIAGWKAAGQPTAEMPNS